MGMMTIPRRRDDLERSIGNLRILTNMTNGGKGTGTGIDPH